MWFKNLRFYPVDRNFVWVPDEEFVERIEARVFVPVEKMSLVSGGWAPPCAQHPDQLTWNVQRAHLLCWQVEEKILPSSAINALVSARIAELEGKGNGKLNKRERQGIKDTIIAERLPQALTRIRRTYAYYDEVLHLLAVDAGGEKAAEAVVSALRKALGSMPVALPRVELRAETVLTNWLDGMGVPGNLVLGMDADLDQEGATIRLRRHPLAGDEIITMLGNGAEVSALALRWDDRVSFTLGADLGIKRLRFLDLVQAKAMEDKANADGAAAEFDADFAIQVGELRRLLPELLGWFGGLVAKDAEDEGAWFRSSTQPTDAAIMEKA